MKQTITKNFLALTILALTSLSQADGSTPDFIETGKSYIGAIAMTGEIEFKVLEIDDNQSWIFVKTDEPVFGEERSAWLNIQHIIALRQIKK